MSGLPHLLPLWDPALSTATPTGGQPTPPIHARRIPPQTGDQVRTPGSTIRHTHSALMLPHRPPKNPRPAPNTHTHTHTHTHKHTNTQTRNCPTLTYQMWYAYTGTLI